MLLNNRTFARNDLTLSNHSVWFSMVEIDQAILSDYFLLAFWTKLFWLLHSETYRVACYTSNGTSILKSMHNKVINFFCRSNVIITQLNLHSFVSNILSNYQCSSIKFHQYFVRFYVLCSQINIFSVFYADFPYQ